MPNKCSPQLCLGTGHVEIGLSWRGFLPPPPIKSSWACRRALAARTSLTSVCSFILFTSVLTLTQSPELWLEKKGFLINSCILCCFLLPQTKSTQPSKTPWAQAHLEGPPSQEPKEREQPPAPAAQEPDLSAADAPPLDTAFMNEAATKVQANFRGFQARKQVCGVRKNAMGAKQQAASLGEQGRS